MTDQQDILVVEDEWYMIDQIQGRAEKRNLKPIIATNEKDAMKQLSDPARFRAAVIDVIVPIDEARNLTGDIQQLLDGKSTGLRIAQYIRKELSPPASRMPILLYTVRATEELTRDQAVDLDSLEVKYLRKEDWDAFESFLQSLCH